MQQPRCDFILHRTDGTAARFHPSSNGPGEIVTSSLPNWLTGGPNVPVLLERGGDPGATEHATFRTLGSGRQTFSCGRNNSSDLCAQCKTERCHMDSLPTGVLEQITSRLSWRETLIWPRLGCPALRCALAARQILWARRLSLVASAFPWDAMASDIQFAASGTIMLRTLRSAASGAIDRCTQCKTERPRGFDMERPIGFYGHGSWKGQWYCIICWVKFFVMDVKLRRQFHHTG